MSNTVKHWTEIAKKNLLGRKIVDVLFLPDKDCESMLWQNKPIIFKLDNGTWVVPQSDDEGNDGGALYIENTSRGRGLSEILPVISADEPS